LARSPQGPGCRASPAKAETARALFALAIRDGDAAVTIPARHREADEIRSDTDAAADTGLRGVLQQLLNLS
jgi:hypothetical protein